MMNGTITTKEAFVGTVKATMEAMYAEGYTVRVQEVQKNNGLIKLNVCWNDNFNKVIKYTRFHCMVGKTTKRNHFLIAF